MTVPNWGCSQQWILMAAKLGGKLQQFKTKQSLTVNKNIKTDLLELFNFQIQVLKLVSEALKLKCSPFLLPQNIHKSQGFYLKTSWHEKQHCLTRMLDLCEAE